MTETAHRMTAQLEARKAAEGAAGETRQTIRPDLCVIGGGAGGLAAAAAAAAFGVNVVLVEKAQMGGATLYSGSLPAQALIASAKRAQILRAAGADIGFAMVRARLRSAVVAVAPRDSPERFNGLGVRVLEGAGRFTDPATVAVNGFDIKARRFVIATGSSPALPPIPGLADTPHLTNETIFQLADCPRHLIVIGAGSVGLALAQAFRRLGAAVTVLDAATPLGWADAECAGIVLDALAGEGVVLRSGVVVERVRRSLARVQVDIVTMAPSNPHDSQETHKETIEGTHLLVAIGRCPNLYDLDLDAAGIRYRPEGIVVDRRLRTSNKQVYAIGDVVDGPKSTHLATHHAGLVVRHALFRTPVRADRVVAPVVTYTDPELAQIGLGEDKARAQCGVIRVLRWSYWENDRAQATGATKGHVKIVTDRKGDILGATIVGASAAENIATWALAIEQGLNIEAMAGIIVPYPAYAEVGKRAARTYFTRSLTSPLVRRIIAWLRRFG